MQAWRATESPNPIAVEYGFVLRTTLSQSRMYSPKSHPSGPERGRRSGTRPPPGARMRRKLRGHSGDRLATSRSRSPGHPSSWRRRSPWRVAGPAFPSRGSGRGRRLPTTRSPVSSVRARAPAARRALGRPGSQRGSSARPAEFVGRMLGVFVERRLPAPIFLGMGQEPRPVPAATCTGRRTSCVTSRTAQVRASGAWHALPAVDVLHDCLVLRRQIERRSRIPTDRPGRTEPRSPVRAQLRARSVQELRLQAARGLVSTLPSACVCACNMSTSPSTPSTAASASRRHRTRYADELDGARCMALRPAFPPDWKTRPADQLRRLARRASVSRARRSRDALPQRWTRKEDPERLYRLDATDHRALNWRPAS